MRLVSWNIRLGIQQGLEPIAATLHALDADIVALQEVGRRWVMGPPGNTTTELARLADYAHSFFVPSLSWYPPAQYGHAVLSRVPLSNPRVIRLPQLTDEPRTMLEVSVQFDARRFTLLTTHLSHVADRPPQGEALVARAERAAHDHEPLIIMGDLNEADPDTPWLGRLLECIEPAPAYAPTFPATQPTHRIDWIMSNFGDWTGAEVVDTGSRSDHFAVLAELSL